MAPCGRGTALTQLSLSQVYASRLELGTRELHAIGLSCSCGNFPPNRCVRVVRGCFFNRTSVRKQNLKNKRHRHLASLTPMHDTLPRKAPILIPRPPYIMHPAPPKQGGSILTWIKDAESLCFGGRNFGPYKTFPCVLLYLSITK